MPMPMPTDSESQTQYMHRFMGDSTMMKDYPDQKQRVAIALSNWKKSHPFSQEIRIISQDTSLRNVFGGVVVPNHIAADGVSISAGAIANAAHRFLVRFREVKYRHARKADADVIESAILPGDIHMGDGTVLTKGTWWLGVHVNSNNIWQEIESGKIKGFSLGGFITDFTTRTEAKINVGE